MLALRHAKASAVCGASEMLFGPNTSLATAWQLLATGWQDGRMSNPLEAEPCNRLQPLVTPQHTHLPAAAALRLRDVFGSRMHRWLVN